MHAPMPSTEAILKVEDLVTVVGGRHSFFRKKRPALRAVDGVSFTVHRGEIFGIVGESGSGKSTLGKTLVGILRESKGRIELDGRLVSGVPPRQARSLRRDVQYVHQDSAAALNPWWSIGRTLIEPLVIHGIGSSAERNATVDRMLVAVGLDPMFKPRYPHELSGGQLRRVALARMLVLSPRLLVLDEPTSGLDLSVQATVLQLLLELRDRLGLTYIFISHDLSVVRSVCDRVGIMYKGKFVELAPTERIFAQPAAPYTKTLLAAVPRLTPGALLPRAPAG